MVDQDFTGLPVVKDGKPIGMITRFDILKRGWARISKESETRPVRFHADACREADEFSHI